jgi:hypothetical protein
LKRYHHTMRKRIYKRLFSIVFLFIFFAKMVITLAPFIIKQFDRATVNAVIMQIEIENNGKNLDMSKELVKEYFTAIHTCDFLRPVQYLEATPFTDDEDTHLRTFYPTVPTPPPNC